MWWLSDTQRAVKENAKMKEQIEKQRLAKEREVRIRGTVSVTSSGVVGEVSVKDWCHCFWCGGEEIHSLSLLP